MRLPVAIPLASRFTALVLVSCLADLLVDSAPASAACPSPYQIVTAPEGSFDGPNLISNPEWCGEDIGCYAHPPFSRDLNGVFWSLGTGNPAVGVGDDSGAWHISNWSKGGVLLFYNYYYNGWLTSPEGALGSAGPPVKWSNSTRIDGCVANQGASSAIDGTECTCVLLNDQWGANGYFAVLSSGTDPLGNFHLSTGGDIVLAPMSRPQILNTARRPDGDVEVEVVVPPPATGIFQRDGCDCGPGYKVFAYMTRPGDLAPVDRSVGWFEPALAAGTVQPVRSFGQTTTIVVDCDDTVPAGGAFTNFRLSWRPYTSDGFAGRFGSQDSVLVLCSSACSQQDVDGDGFTACAGDCDDENAAIFPGAPQPCDGLHNDCRRARWPALTQTNEFDDDADLFSECQGDCADSDRGVFPGNGDAGNLCDLDDGLISVLFNNSGYVEWREEVGFSAWNVYRGDLQVLRETGVYTQDPAIVPLAARHCGLSVPWVADSDPPAGATAFYITTGIATDGMESSLGTDSAGVERPNDNPCP